MKIKSSNPAFTLAKVREIAAFVKPSGVTNFSVWVKRSCRPCVAGTCYGHRNYIVARVGKLRFPYTSVDHGAYLGVKTYTMEEALVGLIAHELRHLWQKKVKHGWRVWGAKGQYSERDADAYAIRKVREWRRR